MATPVQKVTIKAKFPLYKKEELAERVEYHLRRNRI